MSQPSDRSIGRLIAVVVSALMAMFGISLALALFNSDGQPKVTPSALPTPIEAKRDPAAVEQLSPGRCVRVLRRASSDPNPDGSVEIEHQTVPCDAEGDLVYTVGTIAPGPQKCPGNAYLEYYRTTATHGESEAPSDRQFTVCLVPNLRTDVCYAKNRESVGYRSVGCTDPDAEFKVSAAHNFENASLCGDRADDAFVYAEPPRTFCRVPAQ